MNPLLILIGAVTGVILVRQFALDPIEQMGFDFFFEGRSRSLTLADVLTSATFWKSMAGMVAGGALGYFVPGMFAEEKPSKPEVIPKATIECDKCGGGLTGNEKFCPECGTNSTTTVT